MTDQKLTLRGQSLVELALVLPILLLLLVLALDVGRAFLGSIGIHNLARIGANYAASHPADLTWDSSSRYWQLMMRDARGIGCDDNVVISPPDFDPDPAIMGGEATVTVSCGFGLVTPLAAEILGDVVNVSATSTFPVRGICVGCETAPPLGSPPPAPDDECNREPDLLSLSVEGARLAWRNAGFTGEVTGVSPDDDARTVASAAPTETADVDGCLPPSTNVLVTLSPLPETPCPADQAYVPNLLGMQFSDAQPAWEGAGFEAANFVPTAAPAAHVVKTQVFGPGSEAPDTCADLTSATVTVTTEEVQARPPYCKVPDLHLLTTDEAAAAWDALEFTGTFTLIEGATPPFVVRYQSLVAHTYELCSAPITVGPDALGETT